MKIMDFHEENYLIHNRIEDFSTNQIPWNGKFSVDQPNRRVVGILYIETREVEVCVCILYYIAPLA